MSAGGREPVHLPVVLSQMGSAIDAAQTAQPPGSPSTQPNDPLGTVGLALLAYGLVQLLSKVVDRLPLGRQGGDAQDGGFTREDRKRLDRLLEIAVADHARLERMQEEVREIYDYARWASEQRRRVDPVGDEAGWRHRGEALQEQLATNQRLIGQALDELREVHARLDNVLRKLRALWTRVGQRRGDRK
jgi:hypothetical protein